MERGLFFIMLAGYGPEICLKSLLWDEAASPALAPLGKGMCKNNLLVVII